MGARSQKWGQNEGRATIEQVQRHTANTDRVALRRVGCYVTESLWKRMLRGLFPDQRKQERLPTPPLVGYLGTARASKPFELGDISETGFCLLTEERWMPGTEMPITLQRVDLPGQVETDDCFTVQATVVRSDGAGVGFSIVLSEESSHALEGNPLRVRWMSREEMAQFMERLKTQPGSEADEGSVKNPVKSAASTANGATNSLKAAFEGGD